jgi:GTP-binding protein HflX
LTSPRVDGPAPKRRKGFQTFGNLDDARDVRVGTRAIVVVPDILRRGQADVLRDAEGRLAESVSLAAAIALDVVGQLVFRVRKPQPATLLGAGQVAAIGALAREKDAGLIVVDAALSPLQQRNLETATDAKVIDRTGLILEIFGERAATREGRLQVELAHLEYQASRLVRSWTHLERQRGGFGFLGGPGETQIETDRRLIRDRMAKLRRELADVTRTRGLQRRRRQKAPYPVVALVGYTNAGKSTLFNHLTGASVVAEDLLFATLDPTMRAITLPGIEKAILSDTVGFVSELPTMLVAAFRATLEEVVEADLILHVRDIAHNETEAQRCDVIAVLGELGVSDSQERPILEVLNKIDQLDARRREDVAAFAADAGTVMVSAATGEGCDALRARISALLLRDARVRELSVPLADGGTVAWLESNGIVLARHADHAGVHLKVRLSDEDYSRFMARGA